MIPETAIQPINSLSLIDSIDVSSVQTTLAKIGQFQMIVQGSLKSGHDYGVIPGTGKPSLLKPGAEKILMLMGITSEYEVTERIQDYDKGFFAFSVKCTLTKGGTMVTEGLGHCNTKEKKYINQDPFTLANTCLKMAKKRSQIDATLTVASLSEIFTQDIEDIGAFNQSEQVETMTAKDAAATKIRFGKHKGQTLKEIFKEDQSYLKWLRNADKTDQEIKKAIELMFNAASEKASEKYQESAENEVEDHKKQDNHSEEKEESKPSFEDPFTGKGETIDISDDDLPF